MRTVLAAVIALALISCSGAHAPRHQAAPHPAATPAVTATAPDANTAACRKFARIAPPLEALLTTAAGNPAALAGMPAGLAALRRAASMLESWSKMATDSGPPKIIFLSLHLLLAGQGLEITAAGMRDPGAATYALSTLKSLARIGDDCARVSASG